VRKATSYYAARLGGRDAFKQRLQWQNRNTSAAKSARVWRGIRNIDTPEFR